MLTELAAAKVHCPSCKRTIGQVYEWEKCGPYTSIVGFKARCPYCAKGFRVRAKVDVTVHCYPTTEEDMNHDHHDHDA